jgi:internalin A
MFVLIITTTPGRTMSELALKLIAENKRSKATYLDLGRCWLTELPNELVELVWLETLNLGDEWYDWGPNGYHRTQTQNRDESNEALQDISLLARLPLLQVVSLNGTSVASLAALAGLMHLRNLNALGCPLYELNALAGVTTLQVLLCDSKLIQDTLPLSGLSALQVIRLSSTRVSDISPLSGLSALQSLELGSTQVSDLSPLSDLRALQSLDLNSTRVSDLSPLSGLGALETIDLSSTQVSDLLPLSGLSALQAIYLSSTQVSDLLPLSGLSALQTIDLRSTQVSDLSPLSGLSALQTIYLSSTQVSDLSPLRGMIGRGREVSVQGYGAIRVENCPLTIPPLEIVAQGYEAILSYFREREEGGIDHLYEAKMLILGEGGAGKTSLLRRLYKPGVPLPAEQESTKGIDIYRHDFTLPNGRTFRLNVWDFGGQEIYHATHQFFLTRRSLYLLLDDTRKDHKSVSDPGFKDWLDLIEMFGDNSPALIFQNEKAGRSKAIDMAGIQARYPLVQDCFKGNLEHQDAADILRKQIAEYAAALPHIGEELPAKWIKARAEIEQCAQQVPHISQQEYFAIYGQHLPFDRTKALHLSRYFHDLGVFLHFQDDPLLARTVILQNPWATQAVYRILDDEAVKARHGHFNRDDCARLLQDSEYADMHPELLALMQRFELCYLLPHEKTPTWFAPQLLPPTKPPTLVAWAQSGDLVVRFRYDFMPKGIISRLMVRQHRLTSDTGDACLTCVLFRHNTSQATAELLAAGNEIELRARGPERKVLLGVLATEIEAINQGFPGLHEKVVKRIPCLCQQCATAIQPFMFEESNLLRRIENNVEQVECDRSFKRVDIRMLLDGVAAGNSADLPEWAKQSKQTEIKTVRIFLASSKELLADRDAFEIHLRRINDRYRETGQYLEIVRWENFFNAMSKTRKQDDYNRALEECDIFVSLFATKAGEFTEEEFDAAFAHFKATGLPYVYTFFRNTALETATLVRKDLQTLWAMQDKIAGHGHFYTHYKDENDLNLQFVQQLQILTEQGKLT